MLTMFTRFAFLAKTGIALAAAIAACAILSPTAHAALLIDPTGGTALEFTNNDDGSSSRDLGGAFSLYGTSLTNIGVATNGYISNGESGSYWSDNALSSISNAAGVSVIAPYYDDLVLNQELGDSVVEQLVANSYYSVTYTTHSITDTPDTATNTVNFQVALFTGNTTINGNMYQAGDIVFSYGILNSGINQENFTTGVMKAGGNSTAAPFGDTTTGQFTSSADFLANFDSATQALLFRPTADGTSYTASITPLAATVVPEGSTAALLGLALPMIGGVAVTSRRKK